MSGLLINAHDGCVMDDAKRMKNRTKKKQPHQLINAEEVKKRNNNVTMFVYFMSWLKMLPLTEVLMFPANSFSN